jgi:hypothetical protein
LARGETENIVEKVTGKKFRIICLVDHIGEFLFREEKSCWGDSVVMIFRPQTDSFVLWNKHWSRFRGNTTRRAPVTGEEDDAMRRVLADGFQKIVPKSSVPVG